MPFPINFSTETSKYRDFDIEFVGGTYYGTDDAYEAEFEDGLWLQCGGTRLTDSTLKGLQDQIDDYWESKTCETCGGTGRVSFDNPIKTETGIFSERLTTSCDSCEGKGII